MKINDIMTQRKLINGIAIFLLVGLFLFGNLPIYILAYIFFAALMVIRTLLSGFNKRAKVGVLAGLALILSFQIIFVSLKVFTEPMQPIHYLGKLFSTLILLLPIATERFVTTNKNADFYLPSLEEAATISFEQLHTNRDRILSKLDDLNDISKSVSADNLEHIFGDLHRHSSTSYINDNVLTSNYFNLAEKSLSDPYIYIVISNTGSPASEIISVFTKKLFNHASLAFDSSLETILSYNGGINIYPPGLNPETIEAFHQKPDASILVYRLAVTREQKETIINKIKEINREGSAYNLFGLVTKASYKPNIMFCSQFVYKMLELVNAAPFEKKPADVRPTDFVELDYYRKLEFVYEIRFD